MASLWYTISCLGWDPWTNLSLKARRSWRVHKPPCTNESYKIKTPDKFSSHILAVEALTASPQFRLHQLLPAISHHQRLTKTKTLELRTPHYRYRHRMFPMSIVSIFHPSCTLISIWMNIRQALRVTPDCCIMMSKRAAPYSSIPLKVIPWT